MYEPTQHEESGTGGDLYDDPISNSREAYVPKTEVVSCLRGAFDSSTELLKTKTRAILEEFFGLADMAEAFLSITELYHPQTIQSFFENMFNCVVERSSSDRTAAGWLTSHMLEREALSPSVFLEGVSTILEVAEDLVIDIPKIWSYFAEILAPSLLSRNSPLTVLRDSSNSLPEHLAHQYLGQVLGAMVRADSIRAEEAWKQSGFTFADIKVSEVEQFCAKYGLLALMLPPESPVASLKPLLNTAADYPDSPLIPVLDDINFKEAETMKPAVVGTELQLAKTERVHVTGAQSTLSPAAAESPKEEVKLSIEEFDYNEATGTFSLKGQDVIFASHKLKAEALAQLKFATHSCSDPSRSSQPPEPARPHPREVQEQLDLAHQAPANFRAREPKLTYGEFSRHQVQNLGQPNMWTKEVLQIHMEQAFTRPHRGIYWSKFTPGEKRECLEMVNWSASFPGQSPPTRDQLQDLAGTWSTWA